MSINLEKGQNVSLTGDKDIKEFRIGCGWDVSNNTEQFDVDISVLALNKNRKRLSDEYFVFYNNLISPDYAIQHMGDNLTGEGDGDDETILIDIDKLDPNITEILILATIHKASERKQNFGQIDNAFIRIYNAETNEELAKYDLTEDFSIETGIEFGKLYKKDNEWKFKAIGVGDKSDLSYYLNKY